MKQRTYYSSEPQEYEGGKFRAEIRLDIKEEPASGEEGEATQWSAIAISIAAPVSQNKFVKTAMDEIYGNDHEAKLINEYNAAIIGIYTGDDAQAMIDNYNEFLQTRKQLKGDIERICKENNIL